MGPRSLPQGLLAMIKLGTCAKWSDTQDSVKNELQEAGVRSASFTAPQAPAQRPADGDVHSWMLSEWRRSPGEGVPLANVLPICMWGVGFQGDC